MKTILIALVVSAVVFMSQGAAKAQDFVAWKGIACVTNATCTATNFPNANPIAGARDIYHGWLRQVVVELTGAANPTGTVQITTAPSRYTGKRRVLFTKSVTSSGVVSNSSAGIPVFAPLRLETKAFNKASITAAVYTVLSPMP